MNAFVSRSRTVEVDPLNAGWKFVRITFGLKNLAIVTVYIILGVRAAYVLGDRLRRQPNAAILYKQDGQTIRLKRVSDEPKWLEPPGYFERKLLRYRLVSKRTRQYCQH